MIRKIIFSIVALVAFKTHSAKAGFTTGTPATVQLTANEQKMILAQELVKAVGFKKLILENVAHAERLLTKVPAGKDEKSDGLNKKIYAATSEKFKNEKEVLIKNATEGIQKAVANRYTEAELKYLIQLSTHPLFQNFKNFLDSDAFFGYVGQPIIQAKADLKMAMTEMTPATSVAPSIKK